MEKIKYPFPVHLSLYREKNDSPMAKYGLPTEVVFCKKCVISNQRPNSAVEYQHTTHSKKVTINFDANGVCNACNFTERKKESIDWREREAQFQELCDKHRKTDRSYLCSGWISKCHRLLILPRQERRVRTESTSKFYKNFGLK